MNIRTFSRLIAVLGAGALAFRQLRRRPPLIDPLDLIIEPELEATAQRQPDGSIVLRWRPTLTVSAIHALAQPLTSAQGEGLQRVQPGATSATLPASSTPQPLFALAAGEQMLVVGVREIVLEGGVNFRDLGGYPTGDGRRIRWGRLYRSGSLANLTSADLQTLASLELRLVCDLRTSEETTQHPDRLPTPAPRHVNLPIGADVQRRTHLRAILFDRRRLQTLLLEGYTQVIIDQHASVFGAVMRQLAQPDALPALVHCTAGKDRAGLTIALLLLALGVPETVVAADYTLSNRYFEHFRTITAQALKPLGIVGVRVDDVQPLLVADQQNLLAALAYIRQRYGSIDAYLRDQAGVTDDVLARLRDLLLE